MTIDAFYDSLKRTIARERGVAYDPMDTSLLHRITVQEAAKVLGRTVGTVYQYVSHGYMKRDNGRRAYFAEFGAAEIARCAVLLHLIRDPQLPKARAAEPIHRQARRRHAAQTR